jgi:hypothetical protein
MIERYTIKFGPAVSQKELEKALRESAETPTQLHKMEARVEVIGDFEDLKKLDSHLRRLRKLTLKSKRSAVDQNLKCSERS